MHSKVKTAIVTMSTVDKPTRYMRTRGGAEAKMAKIMKSLRSGGVETDSDLEEPSAGGGHTTVVSANNKGKNVEDTQPSIQTQTTANGTRAAKKKPGKKASKTKNPKVTKKSSASKEVDAAVRKAVVSKLAELEDIHLKKNEAACSSHPREWTGEVPEQWTFMEEMSVDDSAGTENLGQNSESDDESTYAADKTIVANAIDDAGGEHLETPTIASHQQNIAEKRHLNAVRCTQQEHEKAPRPKPRHVQPQIKDLGTGEQASQSGGKITTVQAIAQSGTKTTATEAAQSQSTTKKRARNFKELQTPHIGDSDGFDNDEFAGHTNDVDDPMDGEESDADMKAIKRNPTTKKKAKAGAKEKNKVSMPKLRDEIRVNRKEVPNLETGLRGNVGRDQTFETPATKKNVTNHVEEWVQGLQAPPTKRQRTSVASTTNHSTSSKADPKLKPSAAIASTTGSTSCAVIVGSVAEVLAGRKKTTTGAKRRAEDVKPISDADNEGMAFNPRYEGLVEDEDDSLEQADAASSPIKGHVAAQMSKESLEILHGITITVKEKKPVKRQGNGQLPRGALDNGRWTMTFVPTFLRYVGGTNQDVWTLKPQDAITALQAIWNKVYNGSTKDGQKKVKYLVEQGCAVHDVSIQRLTEWRSSIGSNGLAVVGDFMDLMHLQTTEALREAASELLEDRRYMYLRTKYVTKGGVTTLRQSGRYRGPLVIQTIAQCWIDFDGAVDVPGFIDHDHFPYAALVLSATSVYRALWLWAEGCITKESHDNAKLTKSSSIIKERSQHGRFTKRTNFSKDRLERISDAHMRDVLAIGLEKLRVLEGDIRDSVNIIRRHRGTKRGKVEPEASRLDDKAWGSGYQHRAASSDSDV